MNDDWNEMEICLSLFVLVSDPGNIAFCSQRSLSDHIEISVCKSGNIDFCLN
jgi:hypothetical protein